MTTEQTDERLASRAAAGNRRAFEQLVDRYTGPLLRFCRALMGDHAEAEDRVQETLIKAHENLQRFDADRRLRPWLYKIAQNACLDALRRRKETASLPELGPAAPASPIRPDQSDRLDRAIADLPAKHRAILHYKYALGFNAREIAEQLDLSHADVRTSLHRAIKALRERLDG